MTCRKFSADDAQKMGLVNRVCTQDGLEGETSELAQCLLSKPSVPLLITKEHVNAVAQELASTDASFSDGDLLLGLLQDPETMQAVTDYIQRLKSGRK